MRKFLVNLIIYVVATAAIVAGGLWLLDYTSKKALPPAPPTCTGVCVVPQYTCVDQERASVRILIYNLSKEPATVTLKRQWTGEEEHNDP